MKVGRLIEYSMWNIFLEKSSAKCGGETTPRPFPANYLLLLHINIKFKKKKKEVETSLPALFSAWFLKKNIFYVIFH